jgi:hypothetical protein
VFCLQNGDRDHRETRRRRPSSTRCKKMCFYCVVTGLFSRSKRHICRGRYVRDVKRGNQVDCPPGCFKPWPFPSERTCPPWSYIMYLIFLHDIFFQKNIHTYRKKYTGNSVRNEITVNFIVCETILLYILKHIPNFM